MQTSSDPGRWSLGCLQRIEACPCCGSDGDPRDRDYARRDDEEAFPEIWCHRQCGRCQSIYLRERPDEESLPLAYLHYYTHEAIPADLHAETLVGKLVNGYLNVRFGMMRMPYWRIGYSLFSLLRPLGMKLDVYGRHLPKALCMRGASLLDVGCGNGDFLARASEMGISAWGCDPDPKAINCCAERGIDAFCGDVWDARLKEASFDAVTMSHVIEHVQDAPALLRRTYALLRAGGMLWLALPNPASVGLRLFGASWSGLHPPFHLVIPSQSVLNAWLVDAGFDSVRYLRRGIQSDGLWNESVRIRRRDHHRSRGSWRLLERCVADGLSTCSHRWGEETILVARRPGERRV